MNLRRIRICILAVAPIALIGCAHWPWQGSSNRHEQVTTGSAPVTTHEVVISESTAACAIGRKAGLSGSQLCLEGGLLALEWHQLLLGIRNLDCATARKLHLGQRTLGSPARWLGVVRRALALERIDSDPTYRVRFHFELPADVAC